MKARGVVQVGRQTRQETGPATRRNRSLQTIRRPRVWGHGAYLATNPRLSDSVEVFSDKLTL